METDHERCDQESSLLQGHEKCYGQVKESRKPVDNQKIYQLRIQHLAEGSKDPMLTEIGHCIAGEPFQGELLQAGVHVQHKKLEFDEEVVPIGYAGILPRMQPVVQRAGKEYGLT